jgi:hypothetical protein
MLSDLVQLVTGIAWPFNLQEFLCNLNFTFIFFVKLHVLPAYGGISVMYILKVSCLLSCSEFIVPMRTP